MNNTSNNTFNSTLAEMGTYQEYAAAQLDVSYWNWIDFSLGIVTGAYGPIV